MQVIFSERFGKLFNRVVDARAPHHFNMFVEECFERGFGTSLPNFSQHPTHRFLNQVVSIREK